jgi:hypothetical protein
MYNRNFQGATTRPYRRSRIAWVAGWVALTIAAFEASYRWQIVDTYAPEMRAYNDAADLADPTNRATILMMGDSFTAGTSYPGLLRHKLPGYRVINAGTSGTGVLQAAFVAPQRFRDFQPSIFIYQVYIGNDLFDITYPVNWKRVSLPRNVYWTVANCLRSMVFVNYRLAQYRAQATDAETKRETTKAFSVERYTRRSVIYLQADPTLIQDTVGVQGERRSDFAVFTDHLRALMERCKPGACRGYVLVIPHCAQVSDRYLRNTAALGAVFDQPKLMQEEEYPFVRETRRALSALPNVSVVNPIDSLREAERQDGPVYFENDDHLNYHGQEVIAETLLREVIPHTRPPRHRF